MIKDTERINYEYFYKLDIWEYLTNNIKFINDFEEEDLLKPRQKRK